MSWPLLMFVLDVSGVFFPFSFLEATIFESPLSLSMQWDLSVQDFYKDHLFSGLKRGMVRGEGL